MAATRDVVIIGAGHNGLVTAFYLAKAGFKPLVLERRSVVGGAAITEQFSPGFRCSTLAHSAGPLLPEVVRDMQLERHGLKLITSEAALTALSPDGRALVLYNDVMRAVQEIGKFSNNDAIKYPALQVSLEKIGRVIGDAMKLPPPNIDDPSSSDLWGMLKTGRSLRKLGKKDMYRVLRWGPMAVADLVAEFFETELLRAAIAARGIFGTALGPWSAGSSLVLLLRAAGDPHPAGSAVFPAGGIGTITQAMAAAAREAGAEIRPDAEISEIKVEEGAVTGVVLASGGEEIAARAVISNADPRRTLLKLLDPMHLAPDFVLKLQNYRIPGTVAKINFALSGLPKFTALNGNEAALRGRIQIGPEIDYLERAFDESKYGSFSLHPYLEITIPSLSDPALAPAGKHVVSVYMQYAPFKLKSGGWDGQRDALGNTVVKTITEYAPNFAGLVEDAQIITPKDLEQTYGLTGGHIFHGELALDQFFTMRPLLDWARYRTPIANLYLCGSGTHPGVGLTGGSGANAAREILKQLRR
jgi:phytoene dehydrogenase-like protein